MPNVLKPEKRVAIVAVLTQGRSIRSTAHIVGVSRSTVTKLLTDLGEACTAYMDEHLRNLPCERVQADEIWSFVYAKQKNLPQETRGEFGVGDVWTWTAICVDTKLCVSWLVGSRDSVVATEFVRDVASRLANRVQLTTDGPQPYLEAVEDASGADNDYAILQELYGSDPQAVKRYRPAKCIGTSGEKVRGKPDPAHVSTSRVNLTMRMSIRTRRLTQFTYAFSKKVEKHAAAIALHFMIYNFCRVHGTLKATPAVAAGIAQQPWKLEDVVALIDARI